MPVTDVQDTNIAHKAVDDVEAQHSAPVSADDVNAKAKRKRAVVALLRVQCTSHTKLLCALLLLAVVVTVWVASLKPIASAVRKSSSTATSSNDAAPQSTTRQKTAARSEIGGRKRGRKAATTTVTKPATTTSTFDVEADADICTELGFDNNVDRAPAVPLLHNNVSVKGFVRAGQYSYYQLCVDNTREYYHVVEIFLEPTPIEGYKEDKDTKSRFRPKPRKPSTPDVDMYLSAHIPRPTIQHATWITAKRGKDHITLFTDLNDWVCVSFSSIVTHCTVNK